MYRNCALLSIGIFVTSLLTGASCMNRTAEGPFAQTANPNAAIEANIRKLREAQEKLSENPKDKDALSVILTLLKDPNGINRSNAAAVLREVGEQNGAAVKEDAVPLLIDMVRHGDASDKHVALDAIRGFGPKATEAIPILRGNLDSPDVQNNWIAAEALGRMRGAAHEAVPDLVKVIKANQDRCLGDELNICRFAIRALGDIGSAAAEATPDLVSLLNHRDPYFRVYLAVALIRIQPNNQEALNSINTLLKTPEVEIRRRTLWELKDIGEEARPAETAVRSSLRDSDEAVRTAASQVLQSPRWRKR